MSEKTHGTVRRKGGAITGHKIRKSLVPFAYISPTAIIMMLLMAIPLFLVFKYSLFDKAVTGSSGTFIGLDNYVSLITDKTYLSAVRNTLVFAVASVLFHLILGLGFAMMLNSPMVPKRLRAMFRAIYIIPWMFTASIVVIIWRLILDPNGIINYILQALGITDGTTAWLSDRGLAMGVVIFINIWAGFPFIMVSLLAGLQGIPGELYEAATVDGGGPWTKFRYVTIPQLKPVIYSMGLLDLILNLHQFPIVWLATGGGPVGATETIGTYTYKLAFTEYDFALSSTSGVILFVVSAGFAIFYVRYRAKES